MAQRLATEYVKTCLVLAEAEWSQFLQLFRSNNLMFKVKILENGDHEIAIENASGAEGLVLTFERRLGKYVLEGSCRFTDMKLANALRKAVAQFKGDAVVNRIYEFHTVEYRYRSGTVVRITERTKLGERLVFEHKDTVGELMQTFRSASVEAQIQVVRIEINELLDRRNAADDPRERQAVDEELKRMTHRLFVLEA
ncbi:non-ribosomal peptide synthetase module [Paenibacillus sp. TRM 82003]|nr:non-ribosomal peptide synthetase module [Paenibacillus sp. TRM 82003]